MQGLKTFVENNRWNTEPQTNSTLSEWHPFISLAVVPIVIAGVVLCLSHTYMMKKLKYLLIHDNFYFILEQVFAQHFH